jgi:hypothetical protein
MNVIHNTAFLCGCFSIKEKPKAIESINPKWEKKLKTEKDISMLEKFYYPEFVNFCYQSKGSIREESIKRYLFPINQQLTICLRENHTHTFSVSNIKLFVLPYQLLIYAIEIVQDGADLNDITASLSILRNISNYKDDLIKSGYGEILAPIVEIYHSISAVSNTHSSDDCFSYSKLIENGNKLKLFQIIEAELADLDERKQDELLFELGTLAPIGSCGSDYGASPSQEYFNKIMKQNKISIFNNWKGLSLFDTSTILSRPTQSYLFDSWKDDYFGMIYIHSLFLKFYLFRMNILFRKKNTQASSLEKEFLTFERDCCFHKISYNFLPLEIYQSLDTGLEINEERTQLYHLIAQEKNIQEKEGDRKMNNLLFILTCLTIFSTVWDFTCLFNELYPYEVFLGSTIFGYRVITSALLSLVFLVILLYRVAGKKFGK